MPRKLGQHFLHDPAILDRIVEAIGPASDDLVLEIGPGEGSLTRRLAPRVGRVVAIETDRRLAAGLRNADPPLPDNVTVVEGDALKVDWKRVVQGREAGVGEVGAVAGATSTPPSAVGHRPSAPGHRVKVIGNIPYYITSPLIERALRPPPPAVVVFLVQREVADRVVAAPGGRIYGALSVGVQAVARAERLFVVRAGAFRPPPQVDSAVLRLTPRTDPVVTEAERAGFRTFVVGLFGQRRKQMGRALRAVADLSADAAARACEAAGVVPTDRPETLTVDDLARVFRIVVR